MLPVRYSYIPARSGALPSARASCLMRFHQFPVRADELPCSNRNSLFGASRESSSKPLKLRYFEPPERMARRLFSVKFPVISLLAGYSTEETGSLGIGPATTQSRRERRSLPYTCKAVAYFKGLPRLWRRTRRC